MDLDVLSNWLGKDMKKACDKAVQISNVRMPRTPLLPGTPRESRLCRAPYTSQMRYQQGKDWESLRDKEKCSEAIRSKKEQTKLGPPDPVQLPRVHL